MSTGGIKVNMTPSHPGHFIRKEVIEELSLNVTKAAGILLNGNTALTAKMALRIEKAFDVNMEMLLRMQAWHDACRMRAQADDIAVQRYEPVRKTVG